MLNKNRQLKQECKPNIKNKIKHLCVVEPEILAFQIKNTHHCAFAVSASWLNGENNIRGICWTSLSGRQSDLRELVVPGVVELLITLYSM